MVQNYPGTANVPVDWEGGPAVIVSVCRGHPLVLIANEEIMANFERVRKRLRLSHVAFANKLRDKICRPSPKVAGQFHINAVDHWLKAFLKMPVKKIRESLKIVK